jgi:hypothetical protein
MFSRLPPAACRLPATVVHCGQHRPIDLGNGRIERSLIATLEAEVAGAIPAVIQRRADALRGGFQPPVERPDGGSRLQVQVSIRNVNSYRFGGPGKPPCSTTGKQGDSG